MPPAAAPEATPEVPPVPQVDPAFAQLQNDFKESQKTIEALNARVDSLTEALKAAGVITGDAKVGDETPRINPNAHAEGEDAFDDVIATINGK